MAASWQAWSRAVSRSPSPTRWWSLLGVWLGSEADLAGYFDAMAAERVCAIFLRRTSPGLNSDEVYGYDARQLSLPT
ncbi:hypothetical protein ACQPZQ_32210 [Pseudonocardia sp. CA-142604]|uniref:hypothetical protein n=1 Tax=Pseudonocardia sp. CA-142604 TaxID=3240024 RepID=UPI003D8CDE0A